MFGGEKSKKQQLHLALFIRRVIHDVSGVTRVQLFSFFFFTVELRKVKSVAHEYAKRERGGNKKVKMKLQTQEEVTRFSVNVTPYERESSVHVTFFSSAYVPWMRVM